MFWWFERAGELLRLEILETQPGTFELRVIRADGSVTVETCASAEDVAKRQQTIQADMAHHGWSAPHGWVFSASALTVVAGGPLTYTERYIHRRRRADDRSHETINAPISALMPSPTAGARLHERRRSF